ncbi:putative coiled-coil protein SlyX [Paraburkholderia sp. HC6.4b]|uniref:hypothetical protein n=1 Tax=unclassified Paraburkholderia TaxID=2615204 RepID=UPI00160A4C18|nr:MULTISPECIES: hypothetical protein [unclassified Paraburkholderia]MBB5409238.1 putative coiled-coil protein SlyX [Paraburkholderia sp. HC6.4b]MBB5450966.1 putative coiled-coil protein SlyX [Paraburkholderia sp. Kb1A]
MFDKLKAYAAVIVGTVVLALMASLVAYGAYQAHKVKTLNASLTAAQQQVSDLQAANRNLTQQLQLAQTLNRVNDEVVTTVVQAKADMAAAQGSIASSTKAQIESVKTKYAPAAGQMKKQEEADAEAREISAIQITGLWQSYCAAAPANAAGCVEFTSPSHATPSAPADIPSTLVPPPSGPDG